MNTLNTIINFDDNHDINLAESNSMDTFTATMIAEGCYDMAGVDPDRDDLEELTIEAYQLLIDTGVVWQLQGSFGRAAQHLIDTGLCYAAGGDA